MTFKVKLYGSRGSLPTSTNPQTLFNKTKILLNDFVEFYKQNQANENIIDNFLSSKNYNDIAGYGGNTISVDVSNKDDKLIIDAGSGLRELGYTYMNGDCGAGKGEVHLFLTHFHWDHLIGLPFFIPLYIKGNKINIYAVQEGLEENIRSLFKKPFFPVTFDELASDIEFHSLKPRESFKLNSFEIIPYQLDHPDPCWGYKIISDNKVYSHCVDSECTRMSRKDLGEDLPLYQNVDLLLFDAQYSMDEITVRINWGHSAAPIGLDIALREQTKKIVFIHHDPSASDERIHNAIKNTERYFKVLKKQKQKMKQELPEIEWLFGYDGLEIEV